MSATNEEQKCPYTDGPWVCDAPAGHPIGQHYLVKPENRL